MELFSLEEKAAPLPGGLFVCVKLLNTRVDHASARNFCAKKIFELSYSACHATRISPPPRSVSAQHCSSCDAFYFRRGIRCGDRDKQSQSNTRSAASDARCRIHSPPAFRTQSPISRIQVS